MLELMGILTILLLALGLGLALSGIFTAYFGRGKSRAVGIGLLVVGIVIGIVVALVYNQDLLPYAEDNYLIPLVIEAVKYIGAFLVGALISLGIFLFAIMKT